MIEFIKDIAREAGKIAIEERKTLSASEIHAKGSDKDMVTDVDRRLENFLIAKIKDKYPGHDIYGEETGISGTGSEYRWVIDPIDGTTSYIHDFQYYSVSIALQKNGENIAGVVHAPKLDEMFYAKKGKGAFLNEQPIKVSKRGRLKDSLLATGFACLRANLPENNLKYFPRIMPEIRGIRRCGSAAIDLCYVACGRFDGFWELNLNLYDVAAGVLILEEAGGIVTDIRGSKNFPEDGIIATNALIHSELFNRMHDL
jgi:myo-inositol-1(or 4)-monophosphatase